MSKNQCHDNIFQAEDGIRDSVASRGLGDVYKRQGLVMPPKTDWIWIESLYTGINRALKYFGGVILGGDCSMGKERIISMTVLGTQGKIKLRRNACKPKEIILTTGINGLSK